MTDKPTKIFPCDCMGEGVMVTLEEDEDLNDCQGAPYINLAFWQHGVKYGPGDQLSRWERIKYAWQILWRGTLWTAMVTMKKDVARNLANHILYLIAMAKRKKAIDSLVEWPEDPEKPHPYLCVKHGGSSACEESNRKNDFTCPKCEEEIERQWQHDADEELSVLEQKEER